MTASTSRCHLAAAISGLFVLVATQSALAQTVRRSESGGGDPVARVQAQFQQLGAERAALQEENRTLKEKTAKLETQLKQLQGEKQGLDARLQRSEGQLSVAEREKKNTAGTLETQEARMKELIGKYRELAENLRTVESERSRLADDLKARVRELGTCSKDNLDLAGLAGEALDRYERKGCLAAIGQSEPFTQIGKARAANLLEDYRQRIEGLKAPIPPQDPPAKPDNPAP